MCCIGPVIGLNAFLQVPPPHKGFLHIRPLLMGTGPVLSLTPAPEFTFLIFVTPVRNYFEVCVICFGCNLQNNLMAGIIVESPSNGTSIFEVEY